MLSLSIEAARTTYHARGDAHHSSEDECIEGIRPKHNFKIALGSLVGGQVESAEACGASGEASADSGGSRG
jgi:hypothetical protein